MCNLRVNLYRKNYPESITSAQKNRDGTIESNTRKLTTVSLLNVKCQPEMIQKMFIIPPDIRTVFRSGTTFRKYLFRIKGETCCSLKVRLEEHQNAVCRGEIEKSCMDDNEGKEKGNPLTIWNEVKILDREEHWRITRLEKSTRMFG